VIFALETVSRMSVDNNLTRMDDADLLERARGGDRAAVDELLRRYRPQVEGFLKRRTRHADDAADLSQEVLLGAATNLTSYRGGGDLRAWLNGIAQNVLKNYYGRVLKRAEPVTSLHSLDEDGPQHQQQPSAAASPAATVERDYAIHHLLAALESAKCSLPEQQVIRLYYQEETCAQISVALQMPAGTVRSHLLRGRRKLLTYLVEHQPELFGGEEGIAAAWQSACHASSLAERPTERERAAWEQRKRGTTEYGGAILKLARHLTMPLAIFWLLVGAIR
jgi:RNA polymerase sigma-70 factor, ECF subfamily